MRISSRTLRRALHKLQKLDMTRRDRSGEQPNKAPKDTVFTKADNKKWWAAALEKAKIDNYRWHVFSNSTRD